MSLYEDTYYDDPITIARMRARYGGGPPRRKGKHRSKDKPATPVEVTTPNLGVPLTAPEVAAQAAITAPAAESASAPATIQSTPSAGQSASDSGPRPENWRKVQATEQYYRDRPGERPVRHGRPPGRR